MYGENSKVEVKGILWEGDDCMPEFGLSPPTKLEGNYVFGPVCLFVCLSVNNYRRWRKVIVCYLFVNNY